MARKSYSQGFKSKVLAFVEAGNSYRATADKFGISRQSVCNWINEPKRARRIQCEREHLTRAERIALQLEPNHAEKRRRLETFAYNVLEDQVLNDFENEQEFIDCMTAWNSRKQV